MPQKRLNGWCAKLTACASATAISAMVFSAATQAADSTNSVDATRTASPIKHVIIIVGENRSFDHLFATYVPRHREETVKNLLSEKIINADGTPGPHFAKAHQYQITAAPNGGHFFGSADF